MSSSSMPLLNKEMHSSSPQNVKGASTTKKKLLGLKCINRFCKDGRNLTATSAFVCNYYQVAYKKDKKVCRKCLNKCIKYYKSHGRKWENGECIIDQILYPNYDERYVIESSSSEREEEQQPVPSTSSDLSNNEDTKTTNIIDQLLEKFFVNNKSYINNQVELCKTQLLDKKKKYLSKTDSLVDNGKGLENKVYALHNKFYEPYTPHVIETVDLGTLNNSYLKSVTKKTKDYQRKTLKIHRKIKRNVLNIDKDLPDFGTLEYPPLKPGDQIYVMKSGYVQPWSKAKIKSVINQDYMHVQIDDDIKLCTTKEISYDAINPVCFPVGTRVIAEFRKQCSTSISGFNYNFYCGIVGEDPAVINKFRYLIFFDSGNVQYVEHKCIRLIVYKSNCVSENVNPDFQVFIKSYLEKYPVRQMLKLTEHKYVQAKYRNSWEKAKVVKVDASLVQLYFMKFKEFEWVYRGSPKLFDIYEKQSKFEKDFHLRHISYSNKPYIEYTNLDESISKGTSCRSTSKSSISSKNEIGKRMLYYEHNLYETKAIKLPKNVPRPKMLTIHNCNHSCVDWITYDEQKTKTISMLSTPLHFGFMRILANFNTSHKCIFYKTPCGKIIRNIEEMFKYLLTTQSKITIDQFDFNGWVNVLNEFKVLKYKKFLPDLSCGIEFKGISMVNNIDDRLPPPMVYLNSRQPMSGVNINLDSNFLCRCDCTDNCQDKSKCACWQLTIEGQKFLPNSYIDPNIGYSYRRLPERVITGIYECNKNCKCSSSCLNRVVQNPLSQKLQLFLTENKGWGVRCLNDVPFGSFVCVYVGNLFTEKDATIGGMNYGDEYLADLDYIEVVEKVKENYESDLPISLKEKIDNDDNDDRFKELDSLDEDYQSTFEDKTLNTSYMSLRKHKHKPNYSKTKRVCRDVPSKSNLKKNSEPSKSVREYFGTNERVYIMDAKISGNIGRYLNHSCCPNTFVQNVFVDTHDLRFPWIAFFALHFIPAGTELTWDYSYEVGSVPGKVMKCQCKSVNCRGRLL